jgi:DNA-binding transcriptional MerR regulator
MKIGAVSQLLDIPVQTIRYYIHMGLLLPEHSGYHYNFSNQDLEELKMILKFKKLNFSLEEILNIVSLYRTSYLNLPRETRQMALFLQQKQQDLLSRREAIDDALLELGSMIEELQQNEQLPQQVSGFSLSHLELLCCPACGGDLTLEDASIQRGQSLSGKLCCSCGRRMSIQEGILLAGESAELSRSTLFDFSSTLLEEYDARTLSVLKQDEQALLRKIPPQSGKAILETNIKRWFFLLKNAPSVGPGNRLIAAEQYPEVVQFYKAQIDKLGHSQGMLFMVCRPGEYPLRRGCIDLWIDYMDSIEHAETEDTFLPKLIAPCMKPGGQVHGVVLSLPDEGYIRSLQELHPELPGGASMNYFGTGAFEQHLKSSGYQVLECTKLRDVWETSKKSGIRITTAQPPARMLYSAQWPK